MKIVEDSKTAVEEQSIHEVHEAEEAIVPNVVYSVLKTVLPIIVSYLCDIYYIYNPFF
jgi:hypothetical protein